ncbi:MAG: SDR family oxidoreductase [Ottowia sp.]|uniref:SDR family NAD(P)-dependent oxidoreductase n=1 Tax=Ottowia sp. TaxID=1898956 RepID=UPI0039E5053D
MNFDLEGRVAIVTGAGQGNGAAIARGLARFGARVVVADIDAEKAAATARDISASGASAWPLALDVRDAAACRDAAHRVDEIAGPASIVVNNAGIRPYHAFDADDRDRLWRDAMDVNVEGVRNMSLAFLPALRATRGTIINITSTAASFASPRSIAYSTSKSAAQMLTRVLAVELAEHGIRVNAIAPGVIETAMTVRSRQDPVRREQLLARIPMKRFGQPEELVGPVVLLASPMASFMTGSVITVDGGFLTS